MKYRNENCEKKMLIEIGIGAIRIETNKAKGKITNIKDRKCFFKKVLEAPI
jgi:hypothetical protein